MWADEEVNKQSVFIENLYPVDMGQIKWFIIFQSLYQVNYMYFQPIVAASILFGVWGIIMTMKMLAEVLKDYHMQVSIPNFGH